MVSATAEQDRLSLLRFLGWWDRTHNVPEPAPPPEAHPAARLAAGAPPVGGSAPPDAERGAERDAGDVDAPPGL